MQASSNSGLEEAKLGTSSTAKSMCPTCKPDPDQVGFRKNADVMKSTENYYRNQERFARDNPVEALLLDRVDCSAVRPCKAEDGELNLVDETQGSQVYIHAPEGARREADLWATIPPLESTDILFV